MKPKPLSGLNHFTVPCAILLVSSDEPGSVPFVRTSCWLPATGERNSTARRPDAHCRKSAGAFTIANVDNNFVVERHIVAGVFPSPRAVIATAGGGPGNRPTGRPRRGR